MVAANYEALRMAALGDVLPLEARSGLALFLRRGMWGWARTLAAAGASQPPIRPLSPSSTAAAHECSGVIHVFASMVMNAAHNDNGGAS